MSRRIPLFDGHVILTIKRTPLTLDEATHTLYNRAITDPTSLTDQERRTITRRPPPEEEDALCRRACGQSLSELVRKAIQNGDSLTYKESVILATGVDSSENERLWREAARLSAADRELLERAMTAATTEEMKRARESAHAIMKRWVVAQCEAEKSLSDHDVRNIQFALRVPWQEHILSLNQMAVCGLLVFFPKNVPEWPSFKERIETAVYHGLHFRPRAMNEEVLAKFTLHYVESGIIDNDGNNVAALQSRFLSMRDGGELPEGLRLDAFLYVDEEAIRSGDTVRPFVWLLEPGETARPLKVHIKHIAPTLFARLTQRDLSPPEARRWPYRHTSELEMLHTAAARSKDANGVADGIWPPRARDM
ncbi:hypothetical protein Aspvir_009631 [Aspergillus viridinutans]|uniref:Uncharacterized protein n=1 Tax=Aspergillus viridinutans TaxID=75553 RepID=A0A9P3F8K3_ASPVI|nr:uncharacterized protein Aspvir_009631 [Aspergillus viridinutans]GIK05518.1 hypothetical protein Aspvir_009631 [Aspergillus viridinutans]